MSDINPDKTDDQYSPTESAQRWEKEITAASKELSKWHEQARKITKKYLDVRDGTDTARRQNLFWSNIQVLKAALYAKPPRVDVSNTNKDANDDVSRVAGNILQRMLNEPMEQDDCDFDVAARNGIGDYLIVGLGQIWYRYEVETQKGMTEPVIDPMTGQEMVPATEFERIISEDALTDYIFWEDFFWSPARTWDEVRWVARRVYMNREQLKDRFGDKIGAAVPISKGKKNADTSQPQNDPWEKAQIFEVWDKTTKKVYWHAKGFEVICDEKDDPLGLDGFFPCPPPLISNLTTSNVMPRADYVMAQDQYEQIDELTTRITYLTKACKMVGVYDKTSTGIGRVFQEGLENQMIPVDNWAAFAEKGGIKGQMDFIPIEQAAGVIQILTTQREQLKASLYEVLGIGDIMRGMTNPDETLGAQQLKAQFGGSRLQYKQMEIGQWVAAGQRIRAQIICDHFQPETIKQRSNIEHSFDAQYADQAIEFLKSDRTKRYRISIEPESMAQVDWAQERDNRTQLLQALTAGLQTAAQVPPEFVPSYLAVVKWAISGFRSSKEIESILDQAIQTAEENAKKPPPPPTPLQEAEVEEKKASAFQKRASGTKDIAEAKKKHAEGSVEAMFGEAALPGNQMPGMAPLEPAPVPGLTAPGAPEMPPVMP